MAVLEVGIPQVEEWAPAVERALPLRIASGLWSFARRKPLGAFCGFVVLFFMVIGDLVPESINKISSTVSDASGWVGAGSDPLGLGDRPVPYLADQLEQSAGVIYLYDKQSLSERLEGSSARHLLGTDAIGRDI